MFQRGGDASPGPGPSHVPELEQGLPHLSGFQSAQQMPIHVAQDQMAQVPAVPGQTPSTQAAGWPPHRWLIPLGAALLMLMAGIFSLTAQYWADWSMEIDPSKFHWMTLQPWGQTVYQAAPALLGVGFGILAVQLFLLSRRWASRELVLRTAFGLLAVAVGIAGWTALFSAVLFPEANNVASAADDATPRLYPWPWVVAPSGAWLLALALLMLAVLFVVPRRWQQTWADEENDGVNASGGVPSIRRGLAYGLVAVAIGLGALFAPYLDPLAMDVKTVTTDSGATSHVPGWAAVAGAAVTPFLFAGLAVLAWAAIHTATAQVPTAAQPTAEPDRTAVDP